MFIAFPQKDEIVSLEGKTGFFQWRFLNPRTVRFMVKPLKIISKGF